MSTFPWVQPLTLDTVDAPAGRSTRRAARTRLPIRRTGTSTFGVLSGLVILAAIVLGGCSSSQTSSRSGQLSGSPRLGADWRGSGGGFGSVSPALVSNGGDPTGVVGSISWITWGGPRAVGIGASEYVSSSDASVADGGPEAATIVAFSLGSCDGIHPAYKRVAWFFPQHGESFNPSQSENACNYLGH